MVKYFASTAGLLAKEWYEVGTYAYAEDRQLWVMPLMSGAGRYSVGLSTVPVADFCPW